MEPVTVRSGSIQFTDNTVLRKRSWHICCRIWWFGSWRWWKCDS